MVVGRYLTVMHGVGTQGDQSEMGIWHEGSKRTGCA